MQVGGAMVAQMVRWGIRFHQMVPSTLGGQATLATCSSHTDGANSNITDATDTIICRATQHAS